MRRGTLVLVLVSLVALLTPAASHAAANAAVSADPFSATFDVATVHARWPPTATWHLRSEECHVAALRLADVRLDNVRARLTGDRRGVLAHLHSATSYGGEVRGNVAWHPTSGDLALTIQATSIDLAQVAALGGASGLRGQLDVRAQVLLPTGDLQQAQGIAQVRLRGGRVLAQSTVADVLLLNFLSSPGHDRGSAELYLRDGQITLRDAVLANDQLSVSIRGQISSNGNLDLRVDPEITSEPLGKIPLLGAVVNGLLGLTTSKAARLRITGTIDQPKIAIRPF